MERLTKQNGYRCTYYLACFGPEEDHEGEISHKCDYCKEELARSEKLATYEDMEELEHKLLEADMNGVTHEKEYPPIELLEVDMKKCGNGIEEKEWVKEQ